MKHRITASLLLLVLTSVNAFNSAPHSNLFRNPARISSIATTTSSKTTTTTSSRQNGVKSPRSISSSLNVATAPVAAVAGAVTGGLFAGGLHAIAGKVCFVFIQLFI